MAINETVTGNDSVAVTGTASAGERTIGVKGAGDSVGVQGEGKLWHGVEGISHSTIGGFGVFGANTVGGTGVAGVSARWIGVYGEASGVENGPAGVWGEHKGAGVGVKAISQTGVGFVATSDGGNGTAAIFEGKVDVTRDLTVQGVTFQALLLGIRGLEQQVQSLERRVRFLESRPIARERPPGSPKSGGGDRRMRHGRLSARSGAATGGGHPLLWPLRRRRVRLP
jgi:hypothetical protein